MMMARVKNRPARLSANVVIVQGSELIVDHPSESDCLDHAHAQTATNAASAMENTAVVTRMIVLLYAFDVC